MTLIKVARYRTNFNRDDRKRRRGDLRARPAIREAQAAGAKSLREIAAALNARGIATARGGKWEATTVRNILRRAA